MKTPENSGNDTDAAADAAFAAFEKAMALLQDRPGHLGRAHLNRANLHMQRADPSAAAQDLAQAVVLLDRAADPQTKSKAQHNLGYVDLLRGNLVGALDAMNAAAPALAPLSPVIRANIEQDRAEVLLAAGRPAEAVAALEAAAAAYGARRLRRFQAEAEFVFPKVVLASVLL